ncbi:MAG TPA: hypothetical protein QGG59_00345 [Planctomycetota bacterium]|jgi:hypothetical protein|nr:hypothetical protein [Planctomycetota bacterium]HJM38545.1 hypothetical protein [Planctomycetota bacterium]|tara:strand:+ start:1688 stop:2017 length:330 start_codon:yes stop_codon:yes gene_type:complete
MMKDNEHQDAISRGKEIVSQAGHIAKTSSPRTYRFWKMFGISSVAFGLIWTSFSFLFMDFSVSSAIISLTFICSGLFAWCNALWEDKFSQVVLYAMHLEKNLNLNSKSD